MFLPFNLGKYVSPRHALHEMTVLRSQGLREVKQVARLRGLVTMDVSWPATEHVVFSSREEYISPTNELGQQSD